MRLGSLPGFDPVGVLCYTRCKRPDLKGASLMGSKTDFSAAEWATVTAGPYFASLYIVIADPNFAFFQEIAGMTKAMMDSASKTPNELIKDVALDLTSQESQEEVRQQFEALKGTKDPVVLKETILGKITAAADTVSAISLDDGQAYRQWLLYLAEATAEASREGGFLGVGSVRVSDKEKAGLDELARALGVGSA